MVKMANDKLEKIIDSIENSEPSDYAKENGIKLKSRPYVYEITENVAYVIGENSDNTKTLFTIYRPNKDDDDGEGFYCPTEEQIYGLTDIIESYCEDEDPDLSVDYHESNLIEYELADKIKEFMGTEYEVVELESNKTIKHYIAKNKETGEKVMFTALRRSKKSSNWNLSSVNESRKKDYKAMKGLYEKIDNENNENRIKPGDPPYQPQEGGLLEKLGVLGIAGLIAYLIML
jgi:hypothetical protein